MENELLSIGRLASLSGLPVSALRFCRRSWNFRSLDHRNSLGWWVFGGRVEAIGWAG